MERVCDYNRPSLKRTVFAIEEESVEDLTQAEELDKGGIEAKEYAF